MAKVKGPKWDQIRLDEVDRREYKVISSHARHGNSTITGAVPVLLNQRHRLHLELSRHRQEVRLRRYDRIDGRSLPLEIERNPQPH